MGRAPALCPPPPVPPASCRLQGAAGERAPLPGPSLNGADGEEPLPGIFLSTTYTVPRERGREWLWGCFLWPHPCGACSEQEASRAGGDALRLPQLPFSACSSPRGGSRRAGPSDEPSRREELEGNGVGSGSLTNTKTSEPPAGPQELLRGHARCAGPAGAPRRT